MQRPSNIDHIPHKNDAPCPIVDLHCDMLHYLATIHDAHPDKKQDIGCAVPYLREGEVRLQVMAISAMAEDAGPQVARDQCRRFIQLLNDYPETFSLVSENNDLKRLLYLDKVGVVASIENASCLGDEDEPLEKAFRRLDLIVQETKRVLYVSLTHHGENRFGGGNTTNIGLKADGRSLLDYLNGKRIAIDLSHTSDKLAHGIIDYIEKQGLDLPIIASHSNFRVVCDHPRNLPDELAQAIINRKGLIGMNFVRAFVHPTEPQALIRHIMHGFEIGGQETICFGADFFCTKTHPDQSRSPFYFKEHEHAGKYHNLLLSLTNVLDPGQRQALAHGNARRFLQQIWTGIS